MSSSVDALIIGGGFYGTAIAAHLVKQRGLRRVLLVERESTLLARASYNNQARVHNGYHYPRSFTTAYRSRINLPYFVQCWPEAVKRDFSKLYAIARRNSKVSAKQFVRFCKEIGAKLEPAGLSFRQLFNPRLIEEVFLVEEFAFDAAVLAAAATLELAQYGVEVRLNTRATAIASSVNGRLQVSLQDGETITSRYVFNCGYSALNQLGSEFPGTQTRLKHEIAELALVQAPPLLQGLGITVMDGPFFSLMPFPARQLHTLSHVRYTPHCHWLDQAEQDPYQVLQEYDQTPHVDRMLRDARRYLPAIEDAQFVESLFEVKTVLVKNETDDGRPILFEQHAALPGCFSVLGGKLDNIFDVLHKLDSILP